MLQPFDPRVKTVVLTVASRLHGIGFALVQIYKDKLALIQCGSASLSATQSRYSKVELECLAIVNAIQKCHYYQAGVQQFEVWTDHRPLVGAFSKHVHTLTNQRLMRMREKVTSYNFTVIRTPGKNHHIADALSRAPVFGPCEMSFEPEQLEHCLSIFDPSLTHMDPSMDDEYVEVLQLVREGKNATHVLRSSKAYMYRRILDLLCIETYQGQDVLVYDGCRLVVPRHKRPAILALLHAGHSGIAKTYRTATQLYYWPSMKADIEQSVANCSSCQQENNSTNDWKSS